MLFLIGLSKYFKRFKMISDTYFYDALGVPSNSSPREIKKAFIRKSAKIDENEPNENMQNLLATAFQVLIDPKLREIYDKHGLAVLDKINEDELLSRPLDQSQVQQTSAMTPKSPPKSSSKLNSSFTSTSTSKHSMNTSNMSSSFLYEKPPSNKTPRKQRRSIQTFDLKLSLKDLYNGCTVPLGVEIEQQCHKCRGTGLASPIKSKCKTCNGSGRVYISSDPFGNGKVTPRKCPDCFGKGFIITKKKGSCRQCLGYGIEKIKANIDVTIQPGTGDGDRLSVEGYDDIKIAILEKRSSRFIREGNDLYVRKIITLTQAICGLSFPMKHLDGRMLIVHSEPQQVITPGMQLVVKGEGFPILESPGQKGDLYIVFDVEFPKSEEITENVRKLLLPTLPKDIITEPENINTKETCILKDSSIHEFGKRNTDNQKRKRAQHFYSDYYSDEEDFDEEDFDEFDEYE